MPRVYVVKKVTDSYVVLDDGTQIAFGSLFDIQPVHVETSSDMQAILDHIPVTIQQIRDEREKWKQDIVDSMASDELPDEITSEEYQALLKSGRLDVNWSSTRKKNAGHG